MQAMQATAEPPGGLSPGRDIVYLRWDRLHESPLNPRRHRDPETLRELMDSLERRGLLENLVARPAAERSTHFEIIAGSRRHQAIAELVKTGRWPREAVIPVRILDATDVELVEHAMLENIQREDLTPLEEADGVAWMFDQGIPIEEIAARLDKRDRWVRQRLQYNKRLAPETRRRFEAGELNRSQAQAFTIGEFPEQVALLKQAILHGYRAPEIRRILLMRTVPLSRAKFDRARYRGHVRRDFFFDDDEEHEHAEDLGEFRRLQLEWCEEQRALLGKTWSWVELQTGGWVDTARFDKDQPPAAGGTIIHLRDDLRIEIHTGLGRRVESKGAPSGIRRDPGSGAVNGAGAAARSDGPALGRAALTKAHMVWARQEKSRRLQLAIAEDCAVAVSLAILGLLGAREVRIHEGFEGAPDDRFDNPALDELIKTRLAPIGLEYGQVYQDTHRMAPAFGELMTMSVVDLMALFAALTAPRFASWPGYTPELGDSELACRVADVALKEDGLLFPLTPQYLEALSREQLVRVARDAGVAEPVGGLKKSEMIDAILLDPGRDAAWFPPELKFAPKVEIEAEIQRAA